MSSATTHPELLKTVQFPNWDRFSLIDFKEILNKVEIEFGNSHRDITIGTEDDYADCYYEGDTPKTNLVIYGVKNVQEK